MDPKTSWWTTPVVPRFQLFEICDQSWCPTVFRTYVQANVARGWLLPIPGLKGASIGNKSGELVLEHLPDPASYTFVDPCAGAGGPVPAIEATINTTLKKQGHPPTKFILTDLYPYVEEWQRLQKTNDNISFVEAPLDAAVAKRLAPSGKKECRIISGSFHHFDDETASRVLKNAIETADAFVILEFQNRDVISFWNMTLGFVGSFLTTLPFFWDSTLILFFTYIIPLVPPAFAWEGYVSSIRTRQPREIYSLMQRQASLDISEWEFKGGIKPVLSPIANLYWYVGYKR